MGGLGSIAGRERRRSNSNQQYWRWWWGWSGGIDSAWTYWCVFVSIAVHIPTTVIMITSSLFCYFRCFSCTSYTWCDTIFTIICLPKGGLVFIHQSMLSHSLLSWLPFSECELYLHVLDDLLFSRGNAFPQWHCWWNDNVVWYWRRLRLHCRRVSERCFGKTYYKSPCHHPHLHPHRFPWLSRISCCGCLSATFHPLHGFHRISHTNPMDDDCDPVCERRPREWTSHTYFRCHFCWSR